MTSLSRKAMLMLSLPVVVFLAGRSIMSMLSDGEYVQEKLRRLPAPEDQKPLNQRIGGYDVAAVTRNWRALGPAGLRKEQHALEIDLVFPLLYGASFLASLLVGWEALGRPFPFRWLMAPVALVVTADWTENSSQLVQLQRFMEGRELQEGCIKVASGATIVKLVTFGALMLFVAVLAAAMVKRAPTRE